MSNGIVAGEGAYGYEDHGTHWRAALPDFEHSAIEDLLRWVCREGKPTGEARIDCPQMGGGTHPEKAFGIVHPNTPLRCFLLLVTDSTQIERTNKVVSGYPHFADGCVNRIRVDKITTWSNGVEGIVHGTMCSGAEVNFFDADFYQHRAVYQAGKAYDFYVAGLAYQLRKAAETKAVISEGPAVATSLKEMRFLICDDAAVDDVEFRTVVEEVGYFEMAGVGYYRIRAVLAWTNDCEFAIYIFAAEALLRGYRPQKGDSIEGWLWLQGRLAC